MYVCPICKNFLEADRCCRCQFKIKWNNGVSSFFTSSPLSDRYREIAAYYDTLYHRNHDVWKEDAGRTEEFTTYVASIVTTFSPKRYLDVGCGEGFLISAVSIPGTCGIDISHKAIESARRRARATFCQGFVESLPFPDNYFDVVTNMGVMEHFIDEVGATKEILRVLRVGGRYIVHIYIDIPVSERLLIKFSEFVYPNFRPACAASWVRRKILKDENKGLKSNQFKRFITQPVQKKYSPRRAIRIFKEAGFRLDKLISKRQVPTAPLKDHNFRLYVLEKVEPPSPARKVWGFW